MLSEVNDQRKICSLSQVKYTHTHTHTHTHKYTHTRARARTHTRTHAHTHTHTNTHTHTHTFNRATVGSWKAASLPRAQQTGFKCTSVHNYIHIPHTYTYTQIELLTLTTLCFPLMFVATPHQIVLLTLLTGFYSPPLPPPPLCL